MAGIGARTGDETNGWVTRDTSRLIRLRRPVNLVVGEVRPWMMRKCTVLGSAVPLDDMPHVLACVPDSDTSTCGRRTNETTCFGRVHFLDLTAMWLVVGWTLDCQELSHVLLLAEEGSTTLNRDCHFFEIGSTWTGFRLRGHKTDCRWLDDVMKRTWLAFVDRHISGRIT